MALPPRAFVKSADWEPADIHVLLGRTTPSGPRVTEAGHPRTTEWWPVVKAWTRTADGWQQFHGAL